MPSLETLSRTRPLAVLSAAVLGLVVTGGLAALTSSGVLDTLLGALAGVCTVVLLAIVLTMVWRSRHPMVSRPDAVTGADRAALEALEPLRAARDDA